jgi:hypothetical protein
MTRGHGGLAMRSRDILALLAALMMSLTAAAGVSAGEAEDKAYDDMLALALQKPDGVDYIKFREIYAASSYYQKAASDPMNFLVKGQSVSIEDEQAFIDHNFPIINTQILALDQRIAPKDSPQYRIHVVAGQAIVETLLHFYDGKSAETAIPVLVTSEEYTIAQVLHVNVLNQVLTTKNGKSYDVLSGVTPFGRSVEIWFDISAFF